MTDKQQTPNPKCTRCKCYWVPDETDIKSSGLCCITCKKCRNYKQSKNKETYQKYKKTYNEKRMEYYNNNKEGLNEKGREQYKQKNQKVKCECGIEVTSSFMKDHLKTKKHLLYMETKKPTIKPEIVEKYGKCECGCIITNKSKHKHFNSNKHTGKPSKGVDKKEEKKLEEIGSLFD